MKTPDTNQTTSDTPETDAATHHTRGSRRLQYDGLVSLCRKLERDRFTIDEIADYIAGWTLGSFDEVQKLGAHVAHNALNQLRDDQDGIKAVRLRKLYQENVERTHGARKEGL